MASRTSSDNIEIEMHSMTASSPTSGDVGDVQPRTDEHAKKTLGWFFFRSVEDERIPSRTRLRKRHEVDAQPGQTQQAAVETTPRALVRSESEASLAPGGGKAQQENKRRTKGWRITENPLYRTKEKVEVVPLYVWCYETVLSLLWPPLNYFRLHLLYIILLSLLGGIIIWGSQLGLSSEMSFLDALFHAVSSCTQTGLFPTNFSGFSRFGQVVVAALIFLGNGPLITLAPVVTRIYYFRKSMKATQIKTDEYRALLQLVWIVPTYYCVLVGTAWIVMGAFMAADPAASDIIERNDNNPAWWALFHAISAFGNSGYSTFGDNMLQWQRYPLPLIVMSFLIFSGNTAFPLLMRFIVSALCWLPLPRRLKSVYKYMLDHPRRCYTHMFPAAETGWLLIVLLFLNSVQILWEIMLDWNSPAYDRLNAGQTLVNIYFQSVAVRTSGFNSVDITQLSVANLWLIAGMMYVAASPVTIALRYTGTNESITTEGRRTKTTNTVGSQAQGIFMKHIILLFISVLFICMMEEVPLATDPNYSFFKIIFEVASGYGTVGLTLGYGTLPYSFCGVWSGGSKFVLILVMILGKHRNLPESIDSAIHVPADLTQSNSSEEDSVMVIDTSDDEREEEGRDLEEGSA